MCQVLIHINDEDLIIDPLSLCERVFEIFTSCSVHSCTRQQSAGFYVRAACRPAGKGSYFVGVPRELWVEHDTIAGRKMASVHGLGDDRECVGGRGVPVNARR